MKRIILIAALALLFIGIALAAYVRLSQKEPAIVDAPDAGALPEIPLNQPPATDFSPTGRVIDDLRIQMDDVDTNIFEYGKTRIAGNYALQDWSDGVGGGQALMRKDDKGRWVLLINTGGAWEYELLVEVGVPEDIAKRLAESQDF